MDKIEQLYNLYLQKGLITSATSLEMFRAANENQQSSLYDLGKSKNLFQSTDLNTFKSAWTGAIPQQEQQVKKKEAMGVMDQVQDVMSGTMASQSAGSSSASQLPRMLTREEALNIKIEEPAETTQVALPPSLIGKEFYRRSFEENAPTIQNADGSKSTHKMASGEVDGKFIAFPTIVRKPGESQLTELSPSEAFDYAIKNNEYASFKTEAEAQNFAEGEYKRGTPLEASSRPEFFNKAIDMITPEFIDQIEEVVVPQMNYQFGPMGFKFEESGATGDWMIATAPDGTKKEFSLDPAFGIGAESTSDELKQWIKDNSPIVGLDKLESQYAAGNKRYTSDKEYRDATVEINKEYSDFKLAAETYFYEKSKVDKEIQEIDKTLPTFRTPEQVQRLNALNQKKAELESRRESLAKRQQEFTVKAKNYDATVGKYAMMQAEQGQDWGATWNEILTGASKTGTTTVVNIGADIGGELLTYKPAQMDTEVLQAARALGIEAPLDILSVRRPGEYFVKEEDFKTWDNWYASLNEQQKKDIENKVRDDVKKKTKYGEYGEMGALEAARTGYKFYLGSATTEAYKEKRAEESFGMEVVFGVSQSLPAMIGGTGPLGWVQRGAQMYSQATDNIYQEMEKNPAFKDVSEDEKILVAAPIGVAEASLEAIGLRNVIANKGLMNKIILRAMGKAGATTTAKTFGELVQNEVESMGGRALLTAAGAALAEAETGAAQQVSEYAIKDIYDLVKEKEMFQTPDFLSSEYFAAVGKSAAAEAVGGLILGIPSAASAAYTQKGYKGMSDVMFQGFEAFSKDDNLQSAFIVDLKSKVSRGEMSGQDAKDALNNYRNSVGLFRALPEGLNLEGKKEAMNLLKEKRDLEQQIEGKDDALVKKQKARIEAIKGELDALTNQPATEATAPSTGPTGNRIQVLTEEEEKRKTALEQAIESPFTSATGLPLAVVIDENLIPFQEAQKELDALNERVNNAIAEEQRQRQAEGPSVLATPEATTSALETLPVEERTTVTFMQEDGTETPVMGNENMLSNLYHQVQMVPEENRTDWQQSVLDAVTVSLKTQIDEEMGAKTLEQMVAEEEQGDWVDNTQNDELYTFRETSLEAVPEQFRDRVKEVEPVEATVRKRFLGLPIGKKETVELAPKLYQYTISGGDIKANKEVLLPKRNTLVSSTAPDFRADIAPSYSRVVKALITPATIRSFGPESQKIKEMSLKYDDLVKSYAKTKSKETLSQITELEGKILNEAQQQILDAVSKIKGVQVKFSKPKRGLWKGNFEPSFNMDLIISTESDSEAVSNMLFDFAERYSQDAFILEMVSELNQDFQNNKILAPLTVFNEDGTTTYPQVTFTFANPLTPEQVSDISTLLNALKYKPQKDEKLTDEEKKTPLIEGYSINENGLTISIINFTENESRKVRHYNQSVSGAIRSATKVLGNDAINSYGIEIKKSKYVAADNAESADQTRQYSRSNILQSFQRQVESEEKLGLELGKLRDKQIELEKRGEKLSENEQARFDYLSKIVKPALEETFESKKNSYEQSKEEVEDIARKALKGLKGFISTFPIKRPARASIKTLRWYSSDSERLGDGARVNIIVESEEDANKVFDAINNQFPVAPEDAGDLRRINEPTDLGYPKRLIEIRTPNGEIAEMQVMTIEGYLAKDGVESFTGDKGGLSKEDSQQKAKERLQGVQAKLGWAIPDGLGHYFYEIQRDFNIDDKLRNKAKELSLKYYDAFSNPNSNLTESFMDEVVEFKKQVDSADKSTWDKGNEGKSPKPLLEYLKSKGVVVEETKTEEEKKKTRRRKVESLQEVALQLSEGDIKKAKKLVERLNKAFPSVKVYVDRVMFDNVINSENVRKYVKDGMVIYGVTVDGDIYINPDVHNSASELFNTSIHEFGHVWSDFMQTTERGRELYSKGVALIEQAAKTDEKIKAMYAEQLRKFDGNKKKALNEMVSILIGNKGADFVNQTLAGKFRNWLNALFTFVKNQFKLSRELSSEQIQDMTLDQFIGTALTDIFSGQALPTNASQVTQLKNPEVAFSARQSPESIIKMGRANGFSEESIKKVLRGRGLTEEEITKVMAEEQGAATRIKLSEEFLQGFDSMMAEANAIIEKMKKDGADKKVILESVMDSVRKTEAYKNANDVQRNQLIRDIEKMLEIRQKSSPSLGRDVFMGLGRVILGDIVDVTKITMTETELLKKQMKDLARGAKSAKIAWMQISGQLAKEIKELVLQGKLTNRQVASIIRRFASVNMFNEDSVDKFVDYMTNVFQDSNYDKKIDDARKKLKTARTNIRTKIGVSEAAAPILNRLFSINPTLIPDAVFNKYLALVDMFGAKGAVLTLTEVNDVVLNANEILDAVNEEVSLSEELAIRFEEYEDKVFDEDGKLDYAKTIAQMLEEEAINEQELELMKKYKNIILPRVKKPEMTEQEIQNEKNRIINGIQSLSVDSDRLPTRMERDLANRFKKLLNPRLLNKMSISQLNNIAKLIDNINNGYLPHYAQLTVERLNAIQRAEALRTAIENAKPLSFSKRYAAFKSMFTGRGATLEMIRRSPLFFIDQVFGDFKTKVIFNAIFEQVAEGHSAFESSMGRINKKLDAAHDAVAKSYKYKVNDTLKSSFKMMTYLVQLEYDTNPESNQVNSAADYIRATVKHIRKGKSKYKERDAEMLEDILEEYGVVVGQDNNGKDIIEIDKNELFNSFNDAEVNAINTIREINDGMRDMAVYTAAVIRGERIEPLNNYVHLPVMHDYKPDERATGTQSADEYNNSLRPSTKAQSLIARTGKVSPINFDAFASAQRGAKFVNLDYYMTEPVRTARKTLNETEMLLEKQGRIPKEQRQVFNAINESFEEVVQNVLTNNFITDSFADEVVNFFSKQGYRAILASATRFVAELASNIGFVTVADPKSFAEGVKYRSIIMSPLSVNVMDNVGSKQTNRLFKGDTLGGRFVDTSIMSQASGVKSTTSKNDVVNAANMIYNLSLKKYKNLVEVVADGLISTPDKVVMRPIWFGSFATEFKNQTGQEVDFDKIAKNDEAYMTQHKEAIEKARDKADERSVLTGATDNPFMGILKGTTKPNQSGFTRAFNNFNNFMTRFAIYEYTTARQGIYAAMGNGTITRKQGAAMLAAVTIRMTSYTLLSNVLASGLVGLVSDEEEPEDEKSFMQKFGQSLASTGVGLILGRDFGNATKGLINFGVEEMNEEFLTELREGDYDPYEDAISFTFIPKAKKGRQTNLTDYITNMSGSFAPAAKTLDLAVRKAFEDPKKEEDAIERQENEMMIRIPLEVLGNLGYVPLYKDVKRVVMDELYRELENAPKETAEKKAKEKAKLHGYENKTDLKRYAPDLYEQEFGAKSPGYEAEKAKKKIEREKEILEQKEKDELYDYVPKQKVGFGSKKFGSGKTKKKSGFGSGNTFGKKKFGQ